VATGSVTFFRTIGGSLGVGLLGVWPTAVAAEGSGPYIRSPANAPRWGDYSFAVPDSGTDAAWLATEYIPPRSSQTTNGRIRNWGTRVLKIRLK